MERLEEMHLATKIVWPAFLYHPPLLLANHTPVDLALRGLWLKVEEEKATKERNSPQLPS